MALSLYRINGTAEMKAMFILFATVNAIYSSIWDVLIDWSLGNPSARYPLLRDLLGLKWIWPYYCAMIVDPILRFNWICYAIYTDEASHSSVVSFFVALSEVARRGIWAIFRIENEHCTNVGNFCASRDLALPYDIAAPESTSKEPVFRESVACIGDQTTAGTPGNPAAHTPGPTRPESTLVALTPYPTPASPCPDLEAARTCEDAAFTGTPGGKSNRTRRPSLHRGLPYSPHSPFLQGFGRMTSYLSNAHAQDFERRKDRRSEEEDGEDSEETGSPEEAERVVSGERTTGTRRHVRSRSCDWERRFQTIDGRDWNRRTWV
ncbi:MAG: hypothetical protein M1821_002275 [Bathelium mastoideum]|nr:MAG: hypothetical protein M1821_002275 [Bathelium mastoideum]